MEHGTAGRISPRVPVAFFSMPLDDSRSNADRIAASAGLESIARRNCGEAAGLRGLAAGLRPLPSDSPELAFHPAFGPLKSFGNLAIGVPLQAPQHDPLLLLVE